ncbi:hypothetical protein [Agrococcus versicolor]|uniref:hypothetical protein n=1 Tax=Agrococcus versicolor TaxID=501482 RepID=UPI0031D52606
MRSVLFLSIYAAVGGCVAFTIGAVLGLPAFVVGPVTGAIGIAVMDRVGLGFGIPPMRRRAQQGPSG